MSWLKGVIPFNWDENKQGKLIPFQVGAMIDDGNSDPSWSGVVTVSMLPVIGQITGLYDSGGHLLPGFQTMRATGGVGGYFTANLNPGFFDIALHLEDPEKPGLGGNSNPCRLIKEAPPPPPPPVPTPVPVPTPTPPPTPTPAGPHSLDLLFDGVRIHHWDV